MTASEARVRATKTLESSGQILQVRRAIKSAIRHGRFTTRYDEPVLPETLSYFKNLGYNITNETTNQNGNGCLIFI